MKSLKWVTLGLSFVMLFIVGLTSPSAKVFGEDDGQVTELPYSSEDSRVNESNKQFSGSLPQNGLTADNSVGDSEALTEETINPSQYLTFKKPDAIIWTVINQEKNHAASDPDKEVFVTKSMVTDQENTVYYSVYSLTDTFIGFTEAANVTLSAELSESVKPFQKYVTITQQGFTVYADFLGTEKGDTSITYLHTYLAKEKITTADGDVLLSLYDANEQLLGYVSSEVTTNAKGPQGIYQPYKKYVTITSKKYDTWSTFNWKKRSHTSKLFGKTYSVTGIYRHISGDTYYSLYDNTGKWHGYVNQKAIQEATGPEGTFQTIGKYVTINSKNYSTWNNFKWQERYKGRQLINRTFRVKGLYRHVNGTTYYSLYDTKGKWYGYVNSRASKTVSHAQGNYQAFEKYVTITQKKYDIWHNFSWKKKNTTNKVFGRTYRAKGLYKHANGTTYYSLYDNKGRWQGYLNSKATKVAAGPQGTYQAYNKYVTITNKKYNLWADFKWKKKDTSSKHFSETFVVKGLYRHASGAVYYSLYDNQGKWYGYANKGVGKLAPGPEGLYQSFGKKVVVTSKSYPLWSNFNWKERGQSSKLFGKTYTARGVYHHANRSSYYSLYDKKGRWQGYINRQATTLEKTDATRLKQVQNLLNKKYNSSSYGIYVMSLTDGTTASINGNKAFTAASTGKIPALYYTQKMINENKINPNKKYQYTDAINQMSTYSYMRGGAGILQGKPFGGYYSLDQIMNWTAKYSDNQGANFLGYYGCGKFSGTMRNEISSIIGRKWTSPFSVSAKENALLMKAVYKQGGRVVSYLQNTVFDDQRIPKYLPVNVAHKIGDVGSYRHDIAIVYGKQPYILSVMTQNSSYETISNMSRDIYKIMK